MTLEMNVSVVDELARHLFGIDMKWQGGIRMTMHGTLSGIPDGVFGHEISAVWEQGTECVMETGEDKVTVHLTLSEEAVRTASQLFAL